MLNEPRLDDNAAWKQRFRAPVIHWTQVAEGAPDRGLAASNKSGISQLYAWDVRTGELRQLTDRPKGQVFGSLSPWGDCLARGLCMLPPQKNGRRAGGSGACRWAVTRPASATSSGFGWWWPALALKFCILNAVS